MNKKKIQVAGVELLNVPHYRQGSFDSLCAYYTGAMMLTTFFPEYESSFGKPLRAETSKKLSYDPLIAYSQGKEAQRILVNWFYKGKRINTVVDVLNRITKDRDIRFHCEHKDNRSGIFELICGHLNDGLPVMLGWSAPDYGDHSVLVTGYWKNEQKWLIVNDPGSDQVDINWDSLKAQKTEKFELGFIKKHDGYRPMKRVILDENKTKLEHWINGKYEPVVGS